MKNSKKESNKPVEQFRLRGISASVFENASERGFPFHMVSVSRSYRDGDEFKTTTTFGRDDLPIVEALIRQAWLAILKREGKKDNQNE